MTQFRKLSASLCAAAVFSMSASPILAAEIPANSVSKAAPQPAFDGFQQWDADALNADRFRRHRYRHNRVDAGDVLAGVLIIGGIAAIANAASQPRRTRSYRTERPDYQENRRNNRRSDSGSGIDRAVDMCLNEIERDVRVENVDGVSRTGSGWNVTGTIYNGDGFTCQIDNDGRVSNISFGDQLSVVEDRQWDDERYREARRQIDENGGPFQAALVEEEPTGPQPAYPGGPIDGDIEDSELGG